MDNISDPFRAARQQDGVLECEFQGEKVPMILRHEDVRKAARDWKTFSSDAPFRVPIPSEEQARAFYDEQKAKLNGEFSKLKVQIMQYLIEEEQRKLVAVYAEELRKNAAVQIYLTEPQPPNVRQLCCNPLD